jgi:hypothetical protein
MPPILLVLAVVTLGPAATPKLPEYPHVRAANARIHALIEDATRRSVTFARLYYALQDTDVILFIEPTHELRSPLSGRLVFVTSTPLARYLRADVRADLPRADMVSIIAHEMQHALEIAGASLVRDEGTMAALYHHIGSSHTNHAFDTEEAQVVARRVRRELLA